LNNSIPHSADASDRCCDNKILGAVFNIQPFISIWRLLGMDFVVVLYIYIYIHARRKKFSLYVYTCPPIFYFFSCATRNKIYIYIYIPHWIRKLSICKSGRKTCASSSRSNVYFHTHVPHTYFELLSRGFSDSILLPTCI
jgi:hypothetical protein